MKFVTLKYWERNQIMNFENGALGLSLSTVVKGQISHVKMWIVTKLHAWITAQGTD